MFETKDPDVLLPELLPFLCQTDGFFEHAVGTSAGSLSPRTNWTQLATYEFALPPLEEQRRIAEVFSAADQVHNCLLDALSAARKVGEIANMQVFESVFDFHDTRPGVTLGSLLTNINERGFSGLPILSVTINGQVVPRDSLDRHVSDATGEEKYIRALPGDLAYNTMRLWQGAIGIVQEEGLISPAYTVIRQTDLQYSAKFFLGLLRSRRMRLEYRRFVKGVASDRWRLYFKDLATITVNLPPPSRAAETTEQLDALTSAIETTQLRLDQASKIRMSLVSELLENRA